MIPYIRVVFTLFGENPITALCLNAVLNSLCTILIYYLVLLGGRNAKIGGIAAALYLFWPAQLFYLIVMCPEYVNMFLILLSLLLFCLAAKHFILHKMVAFWVMLSVGSILLAISGFFKSVDIVAIVALLIVAILYLFRHITKEGISTSLKSKITVKKILGSRFFAIFVAVVLYFTTVQFVYMGLDWYYDAPVNRNPTAAYIYVGMNAAGYGSRSVDVPNVYAQNVLDTNYNFELASKLTYQKILEENKQTNHINLNFFRTKMQYVWSDGAYLYGPTVTMNNDGYTIISSSMLALLGPLCQIYYCMISIFTLLGGIYALIRRENNYILFSSLFIFGFMLVLLISETQTRYKNISYPYIAIVAAYGLHSLLSTLKLKIWQAKIRLARKKV